MKRMKFLALAVAAAAWPALAQHTGGGTADSLYFLSPVIVTATQARERETPVPFSGLNREEIVERNRLQDMPAVLAELPSTLHYSFNGNDIGYTFMNLRGFDQRRLSILVNGVPQNDPEDHEVYWIDMPDLLGNAYEVQVQRGAGNMFYGPPAIGGSVNVVTTPVSGRPRVTLSSALGFQEFGGTGTTDLVTRKLSLGVSSGIIDRRYAFTVNVGRLASEGYRLHSWSELTGYFVGAARYDENMTTRVNVYGGPVADAEAYYGLPKYYNVDKLLRRSNYSYWELSGDTVGYHVVTKPQSVENFSQPHYEILHEWRLSPGAVLHNTLFFIQGDGYFDYDADWVWSDPAASGWFHSILGYDSAFGATKFPALLVRGFVGNKQGGWLSHIDLDHGGGTLTLGTELRIHRSVHWGKLQYASEVPSSAYDPDFHFYDYNGEKDIFSGFFHEVARLDDATTLLANLQVVYNRYGIRNEKFAGHSFDVPYVFVNPRAGINRNFSDRLNGFFSLAYTSREPRLRNLYAAEDAWFGATPLFESLPATTGGPLYRYDRPFASPEHLLDVELGGACSFPEGNVSVTAYWMEFRDELIKSGEIDIFGGSILVNADRTRHAGVELEGRCRLVEGLILSGSATVSRNRIVRNSVYDSSAGFLRILDGNPLAGFPAVMGNLRLSAGPEDRRVSALLRYTGGFQTDNLDAPANSVDAATTCDLDGTLKFRGLLPAVDVALTGSVRNLFNTLYLAGGEGASFYPAAERNYLLGLSISL